MDIHIKNVNKKTHGSFFLVTNFKILVYIENMCLIIHLVLLKKVKLN